MSSDRQWLSHIQHSIPKNTQGYALSSYFMTLEAWRRGIDVKFINKNGKKSELYYRLSYQGKHHVFTVAKGDLVTREVVKICKDKIKTMEVLSKVKIPVPEGEDFKNNESDEEITEYANKLGYPVVLKPLDGTGGMGVISNIKNETELEKALRFIKDELGQNKLIVEKYIDGDDYRIYIIDGEVIGAIKRIPVNIIGDGKSTFDQLTKRKKAVREKNPSLKRKNKDTELPKFLKTKGYNVNSVLEKDEIMNLKSINYLSGELETIDIIEELTDEIKETVVLVAEAIPGFIHGEIELIFDNKKNLTTVIKLNSTPYITPYLFPCKGKTRDIPKAIIDYYFPETKNNEYKKMYYYDFEVVWKSLKKGIVKEVKLPNLPIGEIEAKLFIVSGNVLRSNYGKWIKNTARELQLNGYVKFFDDDRATIVVSGNIKSVKDFKQKFLNESKKKFNIDYIEKKQRKKPVKIGFEIINESLDEKLEEGYFPVKLKGISKLGQKKKKIKINNYENKNKDIIDSNSLKLIKKIRVLGRIVKKKILINT